MHASTRRTHHRPQLDGRRTHSAAFRNNLTDTTRFSAPARSRLRPKPRCLFCSRVCACWKNCRGAGAGSDDRRTLGGAANRRVDDHAGRQSPVPFRHGSRRANLRRPASVSVVPGHRRREKFREKVRGGCDHIENGVPARDGSVQAVRAPTPFGLFGGGLFREPHRQ